MVCSLGFVEAHVRGDGVPIWEVFTLGIVYIGLVLFTFTYASYFRSVQVWKSYV